MPHSRPFRLRGKLDVVTKREREAWSEPGKAANILSKPVQAARITLAPALYLPPLEDISSDWDSVRVWQAPPPSPYRQLRANQAAQGSVGLAEWPLHPSARRTS